jgi:hypothetical protein
MREVGSARLVLRARPKKAPFHSNLQRDYVKMTVANHFIT